MSTIFKSGMTKIRNLERLSFVKIVANMSGNMLGTTEMTLIIKILGPTERTAIMKIQGNNTGCMPVLLEKG